MQLTSVLSPSGYVLFSNFFVSGTQFLYFFFEDGRFLYGSGFYEKIYAVVIGSLTILLCFVITVSHKLCDT